MKIKVKILHELCFLEIHKKGDRIDLKSAINLDIFAPKLYSKDIVKTEKEEDTHIPLNFQNVLIPLGIAMKLPKGFEAIIDPRSSTYKHYGIISANHQGVIDNSYNGNEDQWYFSAIMMKDGKINEGDRICQFRIQLSQKATILQKLRWLFDNKIEFEYVNKLNKENRGGFGTSGRN